MVRHPKTVSVFSEAVFGIYKKLLAMVSSGLDGRR
jgi:hypothetical protein